MDFFANLDPTLVDWVIIPVLIFLARLIDVSLGTLRLVLIARGEKMWAPIIGFLETLIWLIAIGQIMQNLSNVASYLSWAGGFAAGNYLGLLLEERLAMGQVVIRTIMSQPADELVEHLREEGYRVTEVEAQGRQGKTLLLFMVVPRKKVNEVIQIILKHNPKAFYSIEDVRSVSEDPNIPGSRETGTLRRVFPLKKSK